MIVNASKNKRIQYLKTILLFKLIFIILSIYALLKTDPQDYQLFLIIVLPVFAFHYDCLKSWLITLVKISPLFISILLFTVIFDQDYYTTLHLVFKICVIILLSIFLVRSVEIDHLTSARSKQSGIFHQIKIYIFMTLHYVSQLLDFFENTSIRKKGLTNILNESIQQREKFDPASIIPQTGYNAAQRNLSGKEIIESTVIIIEICALSYIIWRVK